MFHTHSHPGRDLPASGSAAPSIAGVPPVSLSGAPHPLEFGSAPPVEPLVPARVVLISIGAAACLGAFTGAGLVAGLGIL